MLPDSVQVHLRLRQHPLVPIQNSLRLKQSRLIRPRVDLNQRIALTHHLALGEMHLNHNPVDLAGDRRGIYGSHRADRVQIDADVPLPGRHRCDCDRPTGSAAPARRGLGNLLVLMQDQEESCGKE